MLVVSRHESSPGTRRTTLQVKMQRGEKEWPRHNSGTVSCVTSDCECKANHRFTASPPFKRVRTCPQRFMFEPKVRTFTPLGKWGVGSHRHHLVLHLSLSFLHLGWCESALV